MKKLILTVAILTSGISTFAISNNVLPTELISVVNEEFKEIALEKLPAAITSAIQKDFSTATIAKAYMNESEQYKLELTMDDETSIVYADKEGNWLEESAVKK
ncbi:hypothetical protein PW52_09525 [Tamlana sedimentorum]|uniref:Beta-lactamase-inhibitor-like PepSY-like domain-containing protein n=1 Tax=Neotamlana sedimentorum TaxID=1435349 RepID=A0A0D7W9X7_9FLAO|nr:hypothetical protein [Tamlana sedimentorum]KJD35946.1 hypothetical protein PW52_09525 [Tamlana sedimentorum]